MYDYLIVGSGLFGATFAYLTHKIGKKSIVIEKRSQLGGNVYCENVKGINIHKYGAHIFHTSNKEVWAFVNSLVEFNRYTNCPVANFEGKLYNLPFNMNTFYQMWGVTTPEEALAKIDFQRENARNEMKRLGISEPRNLEEQAISLIGVDIYEKLIRGYTEKQWGRKCTELPAFIIRRLPVRLTFDNNYFNDIYQGIPVGGYNRLIEALLDGVEVRTETDYFSDREKYDAVAKHIIFTGKIDEFFNYCHGKLQYRSVRFEQETLEKPNFQGNAVINYTSRDVPYTRIIEHKHFEAFGNAVYDNPFTVISREYSSEWKEGMEPYYPVNDERNNALYEKYRKMAEMQDGVSFGGRLAEYRYYDMAPTIESAMKLFNQLNSNV